MVIEHPLLLSGNIVAFWAVAEKAVYDLWINPAQFRRDMRSLAAIKAAERKRDRADHMTAVTFLLLTVSYGMLIVEALR